MKNIIYLFKDKLHMYNNSNLLDVLNFYTTIILNNACFL